MENYISTSGIPEKIVTDQDVAFTGKEFRKFGGKLNVDLVFGTLNQYTRTGTRTGQGLV